MPTTRDPTRLASGPLGVPLGPRQHADPIVCPVIGIVGGIGAGKSHIAAMFADLGCVVSDSDAGVRRLLERASVRDELVTWWGSSILAADGSVDRRAVAKIVFADPMQRRRLESRLHPLLAADRHALAADARRAHKSGVILDAPLLFEAGLDAECDALVFIDAPLELRQRRTAARGWTPADLASREAAQLPLQEKRARCGYIVYSTGDTAATRVNVSRTLHLIAWIRRPGGQPRA